MNALELSAQRMNAEISGNRNINAAQVSENKGENRGQGQWTDNRDAGRRVWKIGDRNRNVRHAENGNQPEVSTIFNRGNFGGRGTGCETGSGVASGNDAMKPSKLQDHLRRCHPDKTEKDLKYFQTLKDKFQKRPTLDRMFASTSQRNDDGLRTSYNISLLIAKSRKPHTIGEKLILPAVEEKRSTLDRMFASTSQRNDDGLRASYNISLLIAKSGKPHTIGEKLILPAVEEVLKTVLHKPASDIIKRIPLSNNTVERRIDEMSSDIESFLCNYWQMTHFSIQLDESTLPDNAALLLAYSLGGWTVATRARVKNVDKSKNQEEERRKTERDTDSSKGTREDDTVVEVNSGHDYDESGGSSTEPTWSQLQAKHGEVALGKTPNGR
ncbi:unnamed protein product [Acanthoscelides obtectus]|uniref:SCAN domain-containing protein 3 n=1 Tax=Acanthoscelides obtectus TaxID=200917 RepID=A0A9P0MIA8_ACAOB|nr:unnamed protein product [Acanthoscelides obtectus]CAK1670252.1 SCAN domain-containing protein 3 [Acanthoscelides obtectus]